ncbi:hypothetical protein [Actinoplanes sp. NPDC026619]|uniref:hypothetical protein n=1 Tax=Actinoplanes sp. NPDC026619 TaxID=3155798 RepID=UPI0033CF7198
MRKRPAILAAAGLLLALAGCANDTPAVAPTQPLATHSHDLGAVPSAGATPSGGGRGAPNFASMMPALQAYAKCMREHGFPMPDPSTDADGFSFGGKVNRDDPKWKPADDACEDLMPAGGPGGNR